MNPNVRRQLKDIQFQAERLINERPSIEDIEAFDRYNEELRNYLLNNLSDPELLQRVRQIPRVLDESNSQVASRGIISAVLTMVVPALVSYFQDRQLIENSKDAIREARGAYASLEFFTRNAEM
jgi:hypothetical protein